MASFEPGEQRRVERLGNLRNVIRQEVIGGPRGGWAGRIEAFDGSTYLNELGIDARADRLEDITDDLSTADMALIEWFGVRVCNDAIPADTIAPTGAELGALLDAEEIAGRCDPYRWMASQLHVVAERR
jgi:hypothetical protein